MCLQLFPPTPLRRTHELQACGPWFVFVANGLQALSQDNNFAKKYWLCGQTSVHSDECYCMQCIMLPLPDGWHCTRHWHWLTFPQTNQTPIKKFKIVFGKFGFQAPGLVPLDSSQNAVLLRGIYVSGTSIWTRIGRKSILERPVQNKFSSRVDFSALGLPTTRLSNNINSEQLLQARVEMQCVLVHPPIFRCLQMTCDFKFSCSRGSSGIWPSFRLLEEKMATAQIYNNELAQLGKN